jgi:hypothetical protein
VTKQLIFAMLAGIPALALAACANPRAVNDANFATAIRTYLASQDEHQCTNNAMNFPQSFSDRAAYGVLNNDTSAYDALVRVGLARRQLRVLHHAADWFNPAWTERVTTYSMTRSGHRYATTSNNGGGSLSARFCFAVKGFGRVTNFTVPGDMGGMTVSQVRYTYTLADVAPWASNSGIQNAFPEIRQTVAGAGVARESTAVTLTNNGWEVMR